MSRRRIIFWGFWVLLASSFVAVQHDTFLRRWLLPTRPVPPTLAKRIGDFHIENLSFSQAVVALGKAAGKRINFSESGSRVINPFEPVSVDLHDATVEDALCALLQRTKSYFGVTIVETDDSIVIRDLDPNSPAVVGVYELSEPQSKPSTQPMTPAEYRDALAAEIEQQVPERFTAQRWNPVTGAPISPPGVQRLGDHLIVVCDPLTRRLITQSLAEQRAASKQR